MPATFVGSHCSPHFGSEYPRKFRRGFVQASFPASLFPILLGKPFGPSTHVRRVLRKKSATQSLRREYVHGPLRSIFFGPILLWFLWLCFAVVVFHGCCGGLPFTVRCTSWAFIAFGAVVLGRAERAFHDARLGPSLPLARLVKRDKRLAHVSVLV